MTATALTAMQHGLQSCGVCSLLSRPTPAEDEGRCPRCDEVLWFRKPASFQRTWAYLIAAAICYIPANVLPVLTTTTAAGADSDTIMQGVVLLWSPTGWPLSLIVLIASIMIPSGKIVALVQLQPLMSVAPASGLFFFAMVVVLTMLAVESFDPRLIWDPASREVAHA